MTRDTPDRLVQEFADGIAAQSEAQKEGDVRTGNRHARRYIRAFEALRALGDAGRNAVVTLLSHERTDVRAMTAAFLLRYRDDEARRVLEELAQGVGSSRSAHLKPLKPSSAGRRTHGSSIPSDSSPCRPDVTTPRLRNRHFDAE